MFLEPMTNRMDTFIKFLNKKSTATNINLSRINPGSQIFIDLGSHIFQVFQKTRTGTNGEDFVKGRGAVSRCEASKIFSQETHQNVRFASLNVGIVAGRTIQVI